jgi:hypothetical protein
MKLTITNNFPEVQRRLDALRKDIATQATARAINRTIDLGRTEMSKAIREEYNLTAAKVREKLQVRRASFKGGTLQLEGELFSRDPSGKRRAINLINFGARETAQGLSVKIKRAGSRVIAARRGFIGNKGRTAFARVGKARLPIRPLQTIDVPQMFNSTKILRRVTLYIGKRFPEVFAREAAFYLKRFRAGR